MAVSKRKRFEVFKRDSFTCQYCGQKAPDVVLEADHIEPRSKGGKDDILNLVTCCFECNRGKGAVRLDDKAVVERRRAQLEELQARREQIEMMADWHKGLLDVDAASAAAVADLWNELSDGKWFLNESGLKKVRGLIRRFGLDEVFECCRITAETYFRYQDGAVTQDSVDLALDKIGGIAFNRKRWRDDPEAARGAKETWCFIREYRRLSHHPANWRLFKWWDDAKGLGVTDPKAAVDSIQMEYHDGGHGSYWSAAQSVLANGDGG